MTNREASILEILREMKSQKEKLLKARLNNLVSIEQLTGELYMLETIIRMMEDDIYLSVISSIYF